ncbi:hypothetical protein BaRGS_00022247 [Batillaria attramentaria]|uniref:Uncharacterized protein n=1 Tax=Batillaria attramentaria TaxID=370345 RepID=A0ABD0KHC4_9CAEN
MAGVGWLSPCLLAALSVFLTPGQCDFQQIVHFSSGDALAVRDVTEGDKPETETPGNESNYAQLETYENPDDIRPYSVLQDGGKLPNIQSDQETALCQNTTVSNN